MFPVEVEQTSPTGSASLIRRQSAASVVHHVASAVQALDHAIGLARNQVDGARRRRSKVGVIGIVAHGELLRVVPQRRDRVAIVVAHDQAGCARDRRRSRRRPGSAGVEREQIHQAAIEGELFGRVVMILVIRGSLGAVQAKRIGGAGQVKRIEVGVVGQKSEGQPIDIRGAGSRVKRGLSRWIHRVGVGAEVMVERNVLLKNNHDVLDGGSGLIAVGTAGECGRDRCP